MALYALAAILLIVIYATLTIWAAFQQVQQERNPGWAGAAMLACSLALLGAGYFLGERSSLVLVLLIVGLLGLQVMAVINGRRGHGKGRLSHHLGRTALSVLLVVLVWLGLGY